MHRNFPLFSFPLFPQETEPVLDRNRGFNLHLNPVGFGILSPNWSRFGALFHPYIKPRSAPILSHPEERKENIAETRSRVAVYPEPPNAVASTPRASPASKDGLGVFSAPPFPSLALSDEL